MKNTKRKKCKRYNNIKGIIKLKRNLIKEHKKDGCICCGEKPKILCLHHSKPEDKIFEIANWGSGWISMELLKLELKKCIPVCVSCHWGIHRELNRLAKLT